MVDEAILILSPWAREIFLCLLLSLSSKIYYLVVEILHLWDILCKIHYLQIVIIWLFFLHLYTFNFLPHRESKFSVRLKAASGWSRALSSMDKMSRQGNMFIHTKWKMLALLFPFQSRLLPVRAPSLVSPLEPMLVFTQSSENMEMHNAFCAESLLRVNLTTSLPINHMHQEMMTGSDLPLPCCVDEETKGQRQKPLKTSE